MAVQFLIMRCEENILRKYWYALHLLKWLQSNTQVSMEWCVALDLLLSLHAYMRYFVIQLNNYYFFFAENLLNWLSVYNLPSSCVFKNDKVSNLN